MPTPEAMKLVQDHQMPAAVPTMAARPSRMRRMAMRVRRESFMG